MGEKKLSMQKRLDDRLAELRKAERDRAEDPRRAGEAPEAGACVVCGVTAHPDGSPVRWRCAGCGGVVCRAHTRTIPGRVPAEYYTDTLCGFACWDKVGRPEE